MRIGLMSLVLLAGLGSAAAARADVFTFGLTGSGAGYSGTGSLTATPNADGSYTVTGITGTGVTGLIAKGGFQGNDNLLFPSSPDRKVDVNGVAFTDVLGGDTFQVDVFSTAGAGYEAVTLDEQGNYNDFPVTFTLETAPTPEPASLLLLGTGALGVGLLGMRRLS